MKEEFNDHSHICKITYKDNFVADVWENIKEVVTDTDYIRVTTHDGTKHWIYIDSIQRLTVTKCPGKNFIGDYGMGYDTAKEDIVSYILDKKDKIPLKTGYDNGYKCACLDILDHIERM